MAQEMVHPVDSGLVADMDAASERAEKIGEILNLILNRDFQNAQDKINMMMAIAESTDDREGVADAHYLNGEVFRHQEDLPEAKEAYTSSLASWSEGNIRANYGMFLLVRDNPPEKAQYSKIILSMDRDNLMPEELSMVANTIFHSAAKEEGKTLIEDALMHDPTNPRILLRKAEMILREGQYQDLKPSISALEGTFANFPLFYSMKGLYEQSMGNIEAAKNHFIKAALIGPDKYTYQNFCEIYKNDPGVPLGFFIKNIQNDPENYLLYWGIIATYNNMSQNASLTSDGALKMLGKVLNALDSASSDSNPFPYYCKAAVKFYMGKYDSANSKLWLEDALRNITEANRLSPKNPEFANWRVDISLALCNHHMESSPRAAAAELANAEDVICAYQACPGSLHSTTANGFFALGDCHQKLGNDGKAIGLFNQAVGLYGQAIEEDQGNAKIYADLGKVHHSLLACHTAQSNLDSASTCYEEAKANFDRAIDMNLLDFYAYSLKANLLQDMQENGELLALYDTIIERFPTQKEYTYYRICLKEHLGIEVPISEYDIALDHYPKYADIHCRKLVSLAKNMGEEAFKECWAAAKVACNNFEETFLKHAEALTLTADSYVLIGYELLEGDFAPQAQQCFKKAFELYGCPHQEADIILSSGTEVFTGAPYSITSGSAMDTTEF